MGLIYGCYKKKTAATPAPVPAPSLKPKIRVIKIESNSADTRYVKAQPNSDFSYLSPNYINGLYKKDFSSCDLTNSDLSYSIFNKCDFRHTNMLNVDLTKSVFPQSDFRGAQNLSPGQKKYLKNNGAILGKTDFTVAPVPVVAPVVAHITVSNDVFDKMSAMGYKALRPRIIKDNPDQLDKYIGWYASVKIDGWQGIWDGKNTMYTRSYGKTFKLPKWWLKLLQKSGVGPLSGEIKMKDSQTSQASLTSLKSPLKWGKRGDPKAFFHVFDVISPKLRKLPFKKRVEKIKAVVLRACDTEIKCPILMATQNIIKSRAHLIQMYKKVIAEEGEGLVLSDPIAIYDNTSKKSSKRVKLKGRNDDEGIVIGYNLGHKKLGPTALKSLTLKYKNTTFNLGIGFKEDDRKKYKTLFTKGTIISFSYRIISKSGKPVEARQLRVRDITTLSSNHWIRTLPQFQ